MEEKEKNLLLIDFFSRYVTDHKKAFIDKVLSQRTKYITLVLDDIFQSQNASAVIRTCECMGIQDIHIIENDAKYSVNKRVLKGSNKWMDLHRYRMKGFNNEEICFRKLRENGYKIIVTDPSPEGVPIDEVSIDDKLAIVMGNELNGISPYAFAQADMKVNIPMYGFTESLNISVSAAICLNTLIPKVRNSDVSWKLTEDEAITIRLNWLRNIVRKSDLLEREFLRSIK
jgi:tRNA (guanosine-2'-O-)-methyltransferase